MWEQYDVSVPRGSSARCSCRDGPSPTRTANFGRRFRRKARITGVHALRDIPAKSVDQYTNRSSVGGVNYLGATCALPFKVDFTTSAAYLALLETSIDVERCVTFQMNLYKSGAARSGSPVVISVEMRHGPVT